MNTQRLTITTDAPRQPDRHPIDRDHQEPVMTRITDEQLRSLQQQAKPYTVVILRPGPNGTSKEPRASSWSTDGAMPRCVPTA